MPVSNRPAARACHSSPRRADVRAVHRLSHNLNVIGGILLLAQILFWTAALLWAP